ncbi:MAG: phage holin family protein [Hyphomonadaceae bacterium]|nr:phage holin family protein [Hyphomonadaceae bacterium]
MDAHDPRSIPELVSALTGDLANLVRKESELVRTEVGEKISGAGKAAGVLGVGAALLLGAFLVLLQALVLALTKVMDPVWASVLVGITVGAFGALLVRAAVHRMTPSELAPDRSARQLQKDASMLKEQVR